MKYITRFATKRIELLLSSPDVLILLGPRQVGKTTLAKQLLTIHGGELFNMDIQTDQERLKMLAGLDPRRVLNSFAPGNLIIIDEAQRFPGIGRIVKGWFDAGVSKKFLLLGSSSLDLLDHTAEPLTGRNTKIFLLPLTWAELLADQSWFSKEHMPSLALYRPVLHEALVYGGYPAVQTHADKVQYLQNVVSDYLLKDVYTSGLVRSVDVVKKLATLLAFQVGHEVSVTELSSNLGISRLTVEKYIDILTQTYVLFSLPAWSTNPRKEVIKSKKIYFWDTGIRNALINQMLPVSGRGDIGSVWENWAMAELAKKTLTPLGLPLYFWRTRNGSEVDVIVQKGSTLSAYEMKWGEKTVAKHKSFTRMYGTGVATINPSTINDILLSE